MRRTQIALKNMPTGNNMADIGTQVLDKDSIARHMESLGCVRFDQQSLGTLGRAGVCVNGQRPMRLQPTRDRTTQSVDAPIVMQYTKNDLIGSDACAHARRFSAPYGRCT